MRLLKINFIVLLTIIMNINLLSCTSQKKDDLKIKWQPSVGAPELYPSSVYSGCFLSGNKFCGLPTEGFNNNGWGETGLTMGTGHFVPDTLDITWFSYVENKFFHGTFQLPSDTMRALFKKGLVLENGFFLTYDMLVVNTYPEGGLALWMMISGGHKVEIGHYKGTEIDLKFSALFPNIDESKRDSLINKWLNADAKGAIENYNVNGLSPGLYQSYRPRYPWTVELQPCEQRTTREIRIKFYNGEREVMWGKWLVNNFFKDKAVPKYIMINWVESDNGRWGADINFDEQETFEAYHQMYKNNPNVPTKLVLVPDYDSKTMKVYLRSDSLEYELRKTHNGLYPRTMD